MYLRFERHQDLNALSHQRLPVAPQQRLDHLLQLDAGGLVVLVLALLQQAGAQAAHQLQPVARHAVAQLHLFKQPVTDTGVSTRTLNLIGR